MGEARDEVVIYWWPDCVFCLGLLLRLRRTRLRYRKVDIREDSGAKAFVRSVADGNETVPTVVVAARALVNPSKREVLGAVRAYAPHALGDGNKGAPGGRPRAPRPEAPAAVHTADAQGDLAVQLVRAAVPLLR